MTSSAPSGVAGRPRSSSSARPRERRERVLRLVRRRPAAGRSRGRTGSCGDAFTISTGAASARLLRLLAVPDFADASFRGQQFAVWTITDNPARTGYVGLGSFGVGSGPSNDEMAEIKALFKKAGLDVTDY